MLETVSESHPTIPAGARNHRHDRAAGPRVAWDPPQSAAPTASARLGLIGLLAEWVLVSQDVTGRCVDAVRQSHDWSR